ncbi:hypothetical protein [Pedobacter sp. JY14-1]|uniref:hypothetical protein n=1 Tax=Pedobacter sp. JY14-1 TaxID=3034151 RepID=UPI0023E0AF4D|nr:hypothetical protein [Pedobacter sp. JY14-1]
MLIKLHHTVAPLFARQKAETAAPKKLTRAQCIAGDRMVMIILFLVVIVAAIIFS